jgi:hypothetical protein
MNGEEVMGCLTLAFLVLMVLANLFDGSGGKYRAKD